VFDFNWLMVLFVVGSGGGGGGNKPIHTTNKITFIEV
jgi:hypothetical protein